MSTNVRSDGQTVTVTTPEGHRIGFHMAELNAASTAGRIKTDWADGVPPDDPETVVRAAKADAETYVAQNGPTKPDEARATQERSKGLGGTLKDMIGLP